MTAHPTGPRPGPPPGALAPQVDGVLVVDKPRGPTSHDVVAVARRVLGERRIGHTGTLDPMATGVLPLVLGRATRLARFLSGTRKRYDATLVLGVETDTYDAMGQPVGGTRLVAPDAPLPDASAVDAALSGFRGSFAQRPPAYSAKKIGGVAAYRRVRRGEDDIELAPAPVTVEALVLSWVADGKVGLTMTVSAGFYVRSLAQDLGRVLGCGAHLCALRRTAAGEFDESVALPLGRLDRDAGLAALVPLEALLPRTAAVVLTPAGATRARHGNPVDATHVIEDGRSPGAALGPVRLLDASGALLAIAEPRPGDAVWPLHPSMVLA